METEPTGKVASSLTRYMFVNVWAHVCGRDRRVTPSAITPTGPDRISVLESVSAVPPGPLRVGHRLGTIRSSNIAAGPPRYRLTTCTGYLVHPSLRGYRLAERDWLLRWKDPT